MKNCYVISLSLSQPTSFFTPPSHLSCWEGEWVSHWVAMWQPVKVNPWQHTNLLQETTIPSVDDPDLLGIIRDYIGNVIELEKA